MAVVILGETPPRADSEWPPRGFYAAYAVLTGFVLGALGAIASLLFNVIGSSLVNQNPPHLIQIYLTFQYLNSTTKIWHHIVMTLLALPLYWHATTFIESQLLSLHSHSANLSRNLDSNRIACGRSPFTRRSFNGYHCDFYFTIVTFR